MRSESRELRARPGLEPEVRIDPEDTSPATLCRSVAAARRALEVALARVPGYGFPDDPGISLRYADVLRGPFERRRRPRDESDVPWSDLRVWPPRFPEGID